MLAILALTFPFFALVLCGFLAVRGGMLPQSAIPGLNSFVLYFALPCLLFRFGSSTPLAALFDPALITLYLLCALLMVAAAVGLSRRSGVDWNNAGFGALVAAFPNTGFMGLPLLLALVGPRASGPVIISISIDLIVTSSVCVALSRLGLAGGGHQSAVALRHALRGMAGNPMPWSIVLGALASGFGLALPAPATQTIGLLANAASPVALFTIGAVLARAQASGAAAPAASEYLPLALAKLFIHPALVFGLGQGARLLGMPMDPAALSVMVLLACLPSASNVALLAERFGANTGRIARIILASTALSFLSFSAAVALLI
jgi:malonate transporter